MRNTLSKKAIVAAAVALVALAITAGAAFAAPVLQPGTTSAPGMSGTCTNCHTYAAVKSNSKPLMVSHPYASQGRHRAGRTLKVWGYIAPKMSNTSEATLTVTVQQRVGRSWVTTDGLTATGTVSAKGKWHGNKTNYAATVKLPTKGLYRLRTKLVYLDAKGVEQTKISKFLNLKITK